MKKLIKLFNDIIHFFFEQLSVVKKKYGDVIFWQKLVVDLELLMLSILMAYTANISEYNFPPGCGLQDVLFLII